MKIEYALKQLTRRNIVAVDIGLNRFESIVNGEQLTIHTQNGCVSFMHIKRVEDRDHPPSDYFPGFILHTMKSALRWLKL